MNLNHGAPRFTFLHSLKDKGYAEHCYNLFSPYIDYGEKCSKKSSVYDKRTGKSYGRVYYQSKTSPILRDFYALWYPNGYKVVPMDWIDKYMQADGIALWYQDDGSLKDKAYRIILSTDAFKQDEVLFLKELLKTKFGVESMVDIQGRLDISSRREVCKFQALVEPFIHSSMERKSLTQEWKQWILKWRQIEERQAPIFRTSIYLPYDLYNQMQGVGYSQKLNELLTTWLEVQWVDYLINPAKRYKWILAHENTEKGIFLLTPRFQPHVKEKLDLMSLATGFTRSELVIMALMENQKSGLILQLKYPMF
ncbi:MAG: Endonuclease [Xylanivirga thermophila]